MFFKLGKSEFTDWCTAFMRVLDFEFFVRFEGTGCIRVATILYGYCKQQSLFEQFDMSHSVD